MNTIGVLILLWLVMSRFSLLYTAGKLELGLLTHATCFSNFAYQTAKNKTKTSIFFMTGLALTTIFYIYQIINNTSILPYIFTRHCNHKGFTTHIDNYEYYYIDS